MARREIQRVSEYEYLLVNDDLDEAADKLRIIAKVARFKKSNEEINEFVQKWEDL
ncbi:guanylate kinase [compost metagenome]